jgi:hypothetical protein
VGLTIYRPVKPVQRPLHKDGIRHMARIKAFVVERAQQTFERGFLLAKAAGLEKSTMLL